MVAVSNIVQELGGQLHGDGQVRVARIAPLATAAPGDIAFVVRKHLVQLEDSRATCLIVPPEGLDAALARGAVAIVTSDPYLYYARLTQWWRAQQRPLPAPGIHASAIIGQGVRIAPSASIGPLAVIGDGVVVGANTHVGAHSVVERDVRIGEASRIAPRVFVGEACVLGARCTLHSGAVIGEEGFGFAPDGGRWVKIEQLGAVRLGDDVDIGANTCIDRGALEDTVLEDGVKLDNQIQIAHNVHIGAHTAMAGCVGVAGSARIGKHCTFGGAAMILGHLHIADHVHIGAASVVMRSIARPGQYSGIFPLDDNPTWEKNAAALKQLHVLRQRLRQLEKHTS